MDGLSSLNGLAVAYVLASRGGEQLVVVPRCLGVSISDNSTALRSSGDLLWVLSR